MAAEIIAIGLSHRTAPVELRERVALSEDQVRSLLSRIKGDFVREALILSTCNRTEVYAIPADPAVTGEHLIDFVLNEKDLNAQDTPGVRSAFVSLTHCEAITHLFEVISGIDSLVIGDQQIHAQVKQAFRISDESGTNGTLLTKLAHSAFHVAKRVKSETALSSGAATVSYAAVEFTRKVYDDLHEKRALIIGAGETAEIAARHLIERKIGTLRVANRSVENAENMLRSVRENDLAANDAALPLSALEAVLSESDVVISSTAAEGYILTPDVLARALKKRNASGPLILLDIAVPRDIDPECGKLNNVFLKDIDDLRSIVDQNLEKRKEELPRVKQIIREELDNFLAVQSKLEVGPTIKELREKFEMIRREELDRNKQKLGEREQKLVDEMTQRMMNRLLHTPTVMLKEPRASLDDLLTRVELLRALFALDKHQPSDH
jgi:glutamyl-tRNA reductase